MYGWKDAYWDQYQMTLFDISLFASGNGTVNKNVIKMALKFLMSENLYLTESICSGSWASWQSLHNIGFHFIVEKSWGDGGTLMKMLKATQLTAVKIWNNIPRILNSISTLDFLFFC